MKRQAAVGLLIAPFLLLAGCKTPSCCKAPMLKELDADMPTAIVKQYAKSNDAYVDRGFLWLPGFMGLRMHVSKTADGYHATGCFSFGPLSSALVGKQSADFNDDGELLDYSVHSRCLWGILMSDDTCRDYVQAEETWHKQWSRKFLFGLLGYEGDSDNWRAGYFLFIPIVTSHGHGHKWRHVHDEGVQRENENEKESGHAPGQEREERMPESPEQHHT